MLDLLLPLDLYYKSTRPAPHREARPIFHGKYPYFAESAGIYWLAQRLPGRTKHSVIFGLSFSGSGVLTGSSGSVWEALSSGIAFSRLAAVTLAGSRSVGQTGKPPNQAGGDPVAGTSACAFPTEFFALQRWYGSRRLVIKKSAPARCRGTQPGLLPSLRGWVSHL